MPRVISSTALITVKLLGEPKNNSLLRKENTKGVILKWSKKKQGWLRMEKIEEWIGNDNFGLMAKWNLIMTKSFLLSTVYSGGRVLWLSRDVDQSQHHAKLLHSNIKTGVNSESLVANYVFRVKSFFRLLSRARDMTTSTTRPSARKCKKKFHPRSNPVYENILKLETLEQQYFSKCKDY